MKVDGIGRRALLRRGALLGSAAIGGLSLSTAASAAGLDPRVRSTLLYWMDGGRVPALADLRPGWSAPCAATVGQQCAVRLNDLVNFAVVRTRTVPQLFELRLLGFDGRSPLGDHGLDTLSPADGAKTLVPFRAAEVRANRLLGSGLVQRVWGWDGRIPLQLTHGRNATGGQLIDVPAARGVYFLTLSDPTLNLDPAALMFAPTGGGILHRRLTDVLGRPLSALGYFALSVQPVV